MRGALDFDRFAAAIRRQADIAQFHVEAIQKISPKEWSKAVLLSDSSIAPSVPVQALMEGALHALRNAEDKFYECVARLYGSSTRDGMSHEDVRQRLEQKWPQTWRIFDRWNDSFVRDVRSVRNIATYKADAKRLVAKDWHLQSPGSGTGYRGERAARPYCAQAATKAVELAEIVKAFAAEAQGSGR